MIKKETRYEKITDWNGDFAKWVMLLLIFFAIVFIISFVVAVSISFVKDFRVWECVLLCCNCAICLWGIIISIIIYSGSKKKVYWRKI